MGQIDLPPSSDIEGSVHPLIGLNNSNITLKGDLIQNQALSDIPSIFKLIQEIGAGAESYFC